MASAARAFPLPLSEETAETRLLGYWDYRKAFLPLARERVAESRARGDFNYPRAGSAWEDEHEAKRIAGWYARDALSRPASLLPDAAAIYRELHK